MKWASRSNKQASREYVLDGYFQDHASLFMPGWDVEAQTAGQDVRTGLDMGILDPTKPIYVVERNPEWAAMIHDDLRALGFSKIVLHVGELADLKIKHTIDFVFIDLLGALDKKLCEWMRDVLAPNLAVNAMVGLTMAYSRRNNHFMAECETVYDKHFSEFTGTVRRAVGLSGHQKLVPVLLMKSIFINHHFAYRQLMKYQDSNFSMLTYKFTNFTRSRTASGAPTLEDVLARIDMTPKKITVTPVELTGAKKAWATRRAQGWVHPSKRRSEPEPDVRSLAALKAWETRRQNGWVHPAHR